MAVVEQRFKLRTIKRINYLRVKIKALQINLNQLEFKDVLLNVLLLYKILKKGGTLL